MQHEESIKVKKRIDRSTSWATSRKNQLKRLTNNPKGVSQRRLGRMLDFAHTFMTICRQLSIMIISCFKREKNEETPNHSEKRTEKAMNLCKKFTRINRDIAWFWTRKNILLITAKTIIVTRIPN